ncbi:MAG: universal stress protein, partial [Acidimicrobiia bacterium]|nr:universal stress protein [Acidimicrobiia bacterium]
MQILIATDGNLDAGLTAEMAVRLFEEGDVITLATVVEVPRTLLTELRGFFRTPPPQADIDEDHEYVGQPTAGTLTSNWPGDDAMIARYVDDQKRKRTTAVQQALESRGITPTVVAKESDSPAVTVLELTTEIDADVLIIGTHGRGRFEGLLGSTGTKLARLAPCTVIL